MNAELIETPKTGAANNRHRSKQDYATPWGFITAVEKKFGTIYWDLAASEHNHKAKNWYSEVNDSLSDKVEWISLGLSWLNPPFGDIAPWASKCMRSAALGAEILLLVPASVDSNWWDAFVHNSARVYFINPRISFDGKNPYPKPLALCHYKRSRAYGVSQETGYEPWRWK